MVSAKKLLRNTHNADLLHDTSEVVSLYLDLLGKMTHALWRVAGVTFLLDALTSQYNDSYPF